MQFRQVALTKDFVLLESLEARHLDAIIASAADKSVWEHMSFADLSDRRAVQAWFESALQEPKKGIGLPLAIVDRRSGQLVGSTSLYEINERHQRCELGRSWLVPEVRRSGVNTRAKLLLLTYAFEDLGFERVQLRASAANEVSRAAILSLGATFEGVMRSYSLLPGGRRSDAALYSIVRSEWPQVKQRLLARLQKPFISNGATI